MKMEITMIANLNPGDGELPIEVKVIRKWVSYGKKSECCFIFVDKNGDAIQAGASLGEKNYFDSMVKVDTCYRLSNYICEDGKTFMIIAPHKTGIRLGRATKFQPIPNEGFPSCYFNFLDYDHLNSRLEDNVILTDYIGKVENITDVLKLKGGTLMKIKIENLSGNMIDTTIWGDTALSFNKEAVNSLPSPVIIAVTSTKVTQFLGRLQLGSTPASYIYINPDIDLTKTMADGFVIRNNLNPVLKIEYEKSKNVEVEIQRNRFTLAELFTQNPIRYMGVQFTCKATLTNVDEGTDWFYTACDQCRKKLQRRGNSLACENHEPVIAPKHLYFFTTNISDDTAEAKTTFFDTSAAMLLGKDCETMINQLGYTDPRILPVPLTSLLGKTKIFQMRMSMSSKPGAIDFVVDHVFEDEIILHKESEVEVQNIQQQQCTSSTPIKTFVAPVCAPFTVGTPAPTTPAPTTPSVPSVSSYQKRPRQSSAKKALFETSATETGMKHPKKQKDNDGMSGEDIEQDDPVGNQNHQ